MREQVYKDPRPAEHFERFHRRTRSKRPNGMYEAVRMVLTPYLFLLYRARCIDSHNVPADGPFIVAPNHLSFLDSVLVQALMPRPVAFFAKAEYFTGTGVKGALMKQFFEGVGSIPVERGQQAASVQALRTLLDLPSRERVPSG